MKKGIIIGGIIIVAVILMAVVSFVALPFALSAIDGKDDPLIEDPALFPEQIDISRPGNSYPLLHSINFDGQDLSASIQWFNESGPNEIDWVAADQLVKQNLRQLSTYNQAAQLSYYQIPHLADPSKYDSWSEENLITFGDIRTATRLALTQSLLLAKQGQLEPAIDQALTVYDNCYMMANSNLSNIAFVVAISQCRISVGTLDYLDKEYKFNSGQKNYVQTYLRPKQDFSKGIISLTQFEYLDMKQQLDVFKSGQITELTGAIPEEEQSSEVKAFNTFGGHAYYFKLNQTLNEFANELKVRLQYADKPCEFKTTWQPWQGTISAYYTENSVGKLLNNVILGASLNLLERPCKLQQELNQIINS